MPFEIRGRLGIGSQDRRYADPSKNQLPEDVADPTTVRDDSTPPLRERLLQYRWYFFAVTSALVVLTLYLIAVGSTIVPELLNNPWLRQTLLAGAVGATAYVAATKRTIGSNRHIDWLVLDKPGNPGFYPGWYQPADDDEDYAKFVPCKGFTLLGHRSKPVTVGEINPDIARQIGAANRDLDDPAVIRLDPEYGAVRSTEYGNILVQISNGLELDNPTGFGEKAIIKASLPSMADKDRVEKLHRTIQDLQDDKEHYEQLSEKYKQQRDRIAEQLSGPIDDLIDKSIERGERIARAGRRDYDWSDGDEDVPPGDDVMAQVDQEVAPDE